MLFQSWKGQRGVDRNFGALRATSRKNFLQRNFVLGPFFTQGKDFRSWAKNRHFILCHGMAQGQLQLVPQSSAKICELAQGQLLSSERG